MTPRIPDDQRKRKPKRYFAAEEIDRIRTWASYGMSGIWIARQLGRPSGPVYTVGKKHGITFEAVPCAANRKPGKPPGGHTRTEFDSERGRMCVRRRWLQRDTEQHGFASKYLVVTEDDENREQPPPAKERYVSIFES